MISYASDGPALVVGSPPDLHSLSGCPACPDNDGAGSRTGARPHCQAGSRILREWLARPGQYQRPDGTVYDRIDIARRFYAPDRPWGAVVGMAREHSLSRTSTYDIAERGRVLFEPRMPGPLPCRQDILPCSAHSPATNTEEPLSRTQEAAMLHRLILTSVFPGGVTMRPLEEILEEAPLPGRSASTIWRMVSQAGAKANRILSQIDCGDTALPLVLVAIDETFVDERPILLVAEPVSLSMCGFYVPPDGDYSSATWGPLLLLLQEDQPLPIYGGRGDGAKAYPGPFQESVEEAKRSEDIFHLQAVARVRRLEHEVESMQRRAFRPAWQRAEQALATWIAGDDFLERWRHQVHTLLEWVQRTSSAAENINSILKPFLARKKHFASAQNLHPCVALCVLWHNMRVFKEGKRAGYSPFDILGVDLGEKDWRTLPGYPPVR